MDDAHAGLKILRAQRGERAAFARTIEAGLARTTFYATSIGELAATMRQALHEDEQYAAATGEPMPPHHERALRLELSYWMTYDDLLRAPPVAESEYARFCRDLGPVASQLIRLLDVEQELLTTPLVAHYASMLEQHGAPLRLTRDPVHALVQLRQDREERVHLAHNTYRHLLRETFFETGTTDLSYALRRSTEDEVFYVDATDESFPAHAQRANELEHRLWNHLLRTHARGASQPAPMCRRLRSVGRVLERVLDVENDLLTTPLSAYYERRLDALEEAVRGVDKSFRL